MGIAGTARGIPKGSLVLRAADPRGALGRYEQRDTDGDGVVNAKDLAAFRMKFGTSDPNADLDGSGFVNFQDLAMLRLMYYKGRGRRDSTPSRSPTVERRAPR